MKAVILRDGVSAVLGEVSSRLSLQMAPKAQRLGVPMVSPSSTNVRVTQVGDYVFRVCFIDPFQGEVMARLPTLPITSPGRSLTSPVVWPLWMKLYRSSVLMVCPERTSWMLRMLPVEDGPPLSNKALMSVDRPDML